MEEKMTSDREQARLLRRKRRRQFIRAMFARRIVLISFIIACLIVGLALLAKWIMPYDPNAIDMRSLLKAPSWTHLLGTDQFGGTFSAGSSRAVRCRWWWACWR